MTGQVNTARRYKLDFRALMAQCEENFQRLSQLLALLPEDQAQLVVRLQGSAGRPRELRITVRERCRYTTMLDLAMAAPHHQLPDTEMQVRLYHDARTAEVTAMSGYRRAAARYQYPNDAMHQQDEKHQWNRFLGDWLANVKRHGHLTRLVWQGADSL